MNYIQISFLDIGIALSLVAMTWLISFREKLGLEKDLLVGAFRAFIQLLLVGYVLQYVFDTSRWYLVLLILGLMIAVAASNALKRQKLRWRKLFWILATGIAIGSLAVLFMVVSLVLRVHPWYQPQYIIPLAGMIIGNSMVGGALAANRLSSDIQNHRREIELALSLGATARQAANLYIRDALKTAMMPTISSMMTVGIVQLPGMMTGQIIAGTDPKNAVLYQIVVIYMISAATALTVIIITLWLYKSFFTPAQQLRENLD